MADFKSKTRSNYVLIKFEYTHVMYSIGNIFDASVISSNQFPDGQIRWCFQCHEFGSSIELVEEAICLNETLEQIFVKNLPERYDVGEELEYPVELVDVFIHIMQDDEVLIVTEIGSEQFKYLSSSAEAFNKNGSLVKVEPMVELWDKLQKLGYGNTISAPEY